MSEPHALVVDLQRLTVGRQLPPAHVSVFADWQSAVDGAFDMLCNHEYYETRPNGEIWSIECDSIEPPQRFDSKHEAIEDFIARYEFVEETFRIMPADLSPFGSSGCTVEVAQTEAVTQEWLVGYLGGFKTGKSVWDDAQRLQVVLTDGLWRCYWQNVFLRTVFTRQEVIDLCRGIDFQPSPQTGRYQYALVDSEESV